MGQISGGEQATELAWAWLVAATAVGPLLALGWPPVDAQVEWPGEGKHEGEPAAASSINSFPSAQQDIRVIPPLS